MKKWITLLATAIFLASFSANAQEANVEDQIKGVIPSEASVDTTEQGILKNVPYQKGKLHFAASVGYALPVLDLEDTNGSLPIRIAADYFLIDGLALGLRFVFSPCFVDGSTTMFIFNLEPQILYLFKFGLEVYYTIGLMTVSTRMENPTGGDSIAETEAAAGMALGASYNIFFTKNFGLEIGAEFDFNFNGDNNVLYPLFFVGGKFASGPTRSRK